MPSKQVTIQGVMTWEETPGAGVGFPVFPTNPIAPGGTTPPWGINLPIYPSHPIAPGGGPSQGPGFPTHPIAPGGQPPGIWGPGSGFPTHPIAPGGLPPIVNIPGFPTHPIVPGGEGGESGDKPSQLPMPGGLFDLKWSPAYGWVLVPSYPVAGTPLPPGKPGSGPSQPIQPTPEPKK